MINFLYFFLELMYLETLFQIIFNYLDNEVVKYKIKKIFDKKFEQHLIK